MKNIINSPVIMEYSEIKTFDFHNASRIFDKATEDYSNDSADITFKRDLLRKYLTVECNINTKIESERSNLGKRIFQHSGNI